MTMKNWLLAASHCVAIALAGCGGSAQPENVGRVSGKVTLDGQPLSGAMVTFSPAKPGGSSALSQTDTDGHYKLGYAAGIEGAEIGENRVSVSTYDPGDPDGDPPRPKVLEKVPLKYNVNSELIREVKAGDNTIDLELKNDGPVVPDPELTGDRSSADCGCG